MNKRMKVMFGTAIVAAGLASGLSMLNASADETPPTPPWVDASTGVVDISKMPSRVGVVDANGNIVKNADGSRLMVDARPKRPNFTPKLVDESTYKAFSADDSDVPLPPEEITVTPKRYGAK